MPSTSRRRCPKAQICRMLHPICPSTAELDCVIPTIVYKEVIIEIDYIYIEPSAESVILPMAKILGAALVRERMVLEWELCP